MAEPRLSGDVAIIGAGIAGLAAGRRLHQAGLKVVLLDKGRRPGGRLATSRYHDRQFDHGAQYLRPHSRRAAVLFSSWRKAGIITPWRAEALELPRRKKVDTSSWHVALPSQSALPKYLAEDLQVCTQFTALDVSGEKGCWTVIGQRNQSAGPFQAVFVTCPAEQSSQLLHAFPSLHERIKGVESRPCLAAMVEFEEEVMVDFEAAFVSGSSLAWVCKDSAKPGRVPKECWVFHATEEWSQQNLKETPDIVASRMLSAFADLCPVELPPVSFCRSHRWRYAYGVEVKESTHLYQSDLALGVAGDWCNTPNVDGAYWSGYDLAESYLQG